VTIKIQYDDDQFIVSYGSQFTETYPGIDEALEGFRKHLLLFRAASKITGHREANNE
jgi:hypothetical protein